MDYKNIVITNILFSTVIGGGAFAQTTWDVQDGQHNWTGDTYINQVTNWWPGSGIRGDGILTAIINTDGSINVDDNFSGVFLSNNAAVTFQNSEKDKIFSANNNGWEGFLVESGAGLTINDMIVSANGNAGHGLRASQGGQVYINNTSTVEFNNNGAHGLLSDGEDSVIAITGKDDNSSKLYANNNQGSEWSSGLWSGNGALTSITNMNMEVQGNGLAGIMLWDRGKMNLSGDGRQTLTVTANGLDKDGGVIVKGDSALNISGMNISISDNGKYGLQAANGGQVEIQGSVDKQNTLTISGNKNHATAWTEGSGLAAHGSKDESAPIISVKDMNVIVQGNGQYGLAAENGGVISLKGNGEHSLEVLGHVTSADNPWVNTAGIFANGVNETNDKSLSTIAISDMNVTVKENDSNGIRVVDGGKISISSSNSNELIISKNNNSALTQGNGLIAESSGPNETQSLINIENMNVHVDGQAYQGIAALTGGLVRIVSTTGNNVLNVFNTRMASDYDGDRGKGIHAKEANDAGQHAQIYIQDMNINANDNELEGLVAADSGVINVVSTTGDHTLKANDNRQYTIENPGEWSYGAGLLAHGASANAPEQQASIIVQNMNVEASGNGHYGLYVRDGGVIDITGDGKHTLNISGNKSTNPDTYDAGIAVDGLLTTSSEAAAVNIQNMEVTIKDNGRFGINVSNGGEMQIGSAKNNTLTVSGNQTGNALNQGVGIHVEGYKGENQSVLDIVGMNIHVSGSPDAGIEVSGNSQLNITGNGSHKLDMDGNGKYGMLAKDGGNIDIFGMKAWGNSSDHALVGIERDGEISLTGSKISTDNDTLLYTWSDSDAQTARFKLQNSIALGNGTKLALFDAHNSVLEATDSYLENAIVTNTNADISSTVSLNSSTWAMKDSSNMTNLNAGESTIDMRKYNGYTTLTAGSLASNRSNYLLNTYFDEPGLTTDKVIVDGGAATGSDNVLKVHATGYAPGTQVINGYGIQVVNLDNATDKSVDFSLYGGVVDSGAWDYYLHRAADDNYYLQTDQQATTTAKTITNIPAIHLSIVKTGMSEFRHRITELREYEVFHPNEVWVRTFGKHLKVDDSIDSKMNLYGIELGYDKEVHENEDNKYYAGIMAGYMYADNIKHHNSGYPDGSARANTPSVGIYGVWDNSDGWYSYGTLRYFWSRMKAQNYTSAGEQINYKPNRNFIAATFELGKQYEDIIDEKSKWIIEPKVALGYAYADSKSFKTNINTDIHYGSSESFTTRAAVLLGYNDKAESGEVYEPYIEVGVNREWLGKTDVTYAGGRFQSEQKGNGVDFAVGLRARTSENWSFIGSLGYETGQVNQGIGGQLGVRYSW